MTAMMEVLGAERTQDDVALLEEEEFVRALVAEQAELEAIIADCEFEEAPEDMEEFHEWLDSMEAAYGELELRDLGDPGFGHMG